jgi:hypothetical protein
MAIDNDKIKEDIRSLFEPPSRVGTAEFSNTVLPLLAQLSKQADRNDLIAQMFNIARKVRDEVIIDPNKLTADKDAAIDIYNTKQSNLQKLSNPYPTKELPTWVKDQCSYITLVPQGMAERFANVIQSGRLTEDLFGKLGERLEEQGSTTTGEQLAGEAAGDLLVRDKAAIDYQEGLAATAEAKAEATATPGLGGSASTSSEDEIDSN